MMEHTTDRLFWTLTAVIIGALLLTIAIKAFPGVAGGIMGKISNVMGTAGNTAENASNTASNAAAAASNYSFSTIASLF